jgi:activating signal cointegrator 1
MRIITLYQPWASFVALGLKHYETRSWATGYRGSIAIHAGKRLIDEDGLKLIWQVEALTGQALNPVDFKYPRGEIVAIANLFDCLKMNPDYACRQIPGFISLDSASELEKLTGGWQSGRFAWQLEQVIALPQPIPYQGGQGLRNLDPEVERQIRQFIKEEV